MNILGLALTRSQGADEYAKSLGSAKVQTLSSTCIKMSILFLHRSCEKLFLLALPNASDMFKLSHVVKV